MSFLRLLPQINVPRSSPGSGRAYTLLARQLSIQVLVSIESIPSGSQRRVITFEAR